MKNALITGGAGFIASHLAKRIQSQYDEIFLLDNLVRTNSLRNIEDLIKQENNKYKFVYGDISNFPLETFKNLDTVFHLAATRINRCAKMNKEGHLFIADGGFNVVDYCSKQHIKLFFASSASVYASPKKFPILEEDPCLPPTLYGSAKLYTEHLMYNYAKMHGLRYAINRFFSVYGPNMDCEGAYTEVIFNWLKQIRVGNNEITVYGNPYEKVLDLVFVDDVVNAIVTTTNASKNDVYNVSTTQGTTLSELISVIEKVTDKKLNVKILPENRNDIELKRVGSTDKLKSLGWNFTCDIEKGIYHTYEWIKKIT